MVGTDLRAAGFNEAPAAAEGTVELRVLGPLEVWIRGRQLAPSAPKPRAVLAALLLDANRWVPASQLIDVVWGPDAPRTAENTLQVYVSRLRTMLSAARGIADDIGIDAQRPGYLLRTDPQRLDVWRFRHLVAAARDIRAQGAPQDAAAMYRDGLDLWRGPALADVASDRLRATLTGLADEYLTATEEWLGLELAHHRYASAIEHLPALVIEHPYRERLYELLMLALHRAGRRADALTVFRQASATLRADLGIEPGPQLERLHREILSGGPVAGGPAAGYNVASAETTIAISGDVANLVADLAAAASTHAPSTAESQPDAPAASTHHASSTAESQPSQGAAVSPHAPEHDDLPRALGDYTGRQAELAHVLAAIHHGAGAPAGTVAIDGMAGVGKTTFAIHLAHQVAAAFAVRLYLDLRGYTAGERPLDAHAASGMLLRALGVPDNRLPDDTGARTSLWRAELAGQRALVVLDNAATTGQILPLLPGGAGSLAIVTSRTRLTGLDGAVTVSLEIPPQDDAATLLRTIVDDWRAGADEPGIDEVVRLCGRLPLAIRLAGARLRHRAAWSAAYLAERLRDEQRRLAELTVDDRSVAATFAVSYDHLPGPQRRMFRLLGLVPGVDVDRYQAAALADTEERSAERMLEHLVDANLLTEHVVGRYGMHDLLREYARARAGSDEPEHDRRAAVHRLLASYLATADAAAALLDPLQRRCCAPKPEQLWPGRRLLSRAEAMAWFEAERANLNAAICYASEAAEHPYAWQLAEALSLFFYLRGYTDDWIRTHETAMSVARAAGERTCEAALASSLGQAYRRRGRFHDALDRLHRALDLYGSTGCTESAAVYGRIGTVYESLGMMARAAAHHREALAIRRANRDRRGEANALNNLGALAVRSGRPERAIENYLTALAIYRDIGDSTGEARVLSNLGEAYIFMRRHNDALHFLHDSLALRRETGDRRGEANTLGNLGVLHRTLGQMDTAIGLLERALTIMREVGDVEGQAEVLNDTAATYRAAGRRDEATRVFHDALQTAQRSRLPYQERRAHEGLAWALRDSDPQAARAHQDLAANTQGDLGDRLQ